MQNMCNQSEIVLWHYTIVVAQELKIDSSYKQTLILGLFFNVVDSLDIVLPCKQPKYVTLEY